MISKRIAMLGAPAVGKTSIIHTLITGQAPVEYIPTKNEIYHHYMEVQGQSYILRIADIPALNDCSSIPRCLEDSTDGYVLCYDVTNRCSFEQIKIIRQRLEMLDLNYPCILVATKVDVNNNREVTSNEGYNLSQELSLPFIECSAHTGYNVHQIIHHLLHISEIDKQNNDESKVVIEEKKKKTCKKSSCIML